MLRDDVHKHKAVVVDGSTTTHPLSGTYDLMDLEGDKKPQQKKIESALQMTTLTGGRVPEKMFQDPMPAELSARFFLPWPRKISAPGPVVRVKRVDTGQNLPAVAGTIDLEYRFEDPFSISSFMVSTAGRVILANAISTTITPGTHPIGSPLRHAGLYYKLMMGHTSTPNFVTTEEVKVLVQPRYIDPVDCTVGTGCAEGDPDCT